MKFRLLSGTSQRWWDLPASFLLFIILTIAFTRLVATNWTENLSITRTITYLGLIAGIALGLSRFSPKWVFIFFLLYGIFVVTWRVGLSLGEGIEWQERLISLVGRLGSIFTDLMQRKPVRDNMLFLVLMATLFWTLSVHAGYNLSRYANAWSSVLPTGIAMVVIHTYDSLFVSRIGFLVAYLFFALLLVARLVFLLNRTRWTETKTYMPPYLGLDLIRISLIVGMLVILLSWAAPALADSIPAAQEAWQKFKQPLDGVRGDLDNAFASLRSSAGMVSEYYGNSTSLGRGSIHSDEEVFTVLTPENPPEGIRYYWRARIYDEYADGQWKSTLDQIQNIEPDDFNFDIPDYANFAPGIYSFAFTIANPIASLFSVNQPIWVSRPVRAELSTDSDGTIDISHFRATPAIQSGETYNTRSRLGNVTIKAMRDAGSNYPEWVTDRYLQLPESITPRTIQLAEDITDGFETQYDKTIAVTQYLRETIQYSEVITAPLPTNQEPIDWFLFDYRQGFCNYYATSQVILLRASGIPARIAFGYAQGEPVEGTTAFSVRQLDAHAWPEVYFPNLGWVEFEPTVSQPILNRPLGETPENSLLDNQNDLGTNNLDQDRDFTSPQDRLPESDPIESSTSKYLTIGIVLSLFLILLILLIPYARRKKLSQRLPVISSLLENSFRKIGLRPPSFLTNWTLRASLTQIERCYMEVNLALQRIGIKPEPTNTPTERVSILTDLLPTTRQPSEILLKEYHLAIYSSNTSTNSTAATLASKEIRRISIRALIRRWLTQESTN